LTASLRHVVPSSLSAPPPRNFSPPSGRSNRWPRRRPASFPWSQGSPVRRPDSHGSRSGREADRPLRRPDRRNRACERRHPHRAQRPGISVASPASPSRS